MCGNGVVEPGEQCDTALAEDPALCTALGFPAAVPYCLSECLVHCAFCGNGIRDLEEACDDGPGISDTTGRILRTGR